ncbi:MAG: cinA [Actinomycetia bacterium]|nr:cinA [Actinomycetes bacterium]
MSQQVDELQERLSEVLGRGGTSVGVAESLTGGELSAKLASAPGSSGWFRGGIVAYASDVKHDLLRVPPGPVVSDIAAVAMASSSRELLEADVSIAVTGVAGPEEQDGQPPGTVWMALSDREGTTARLHRFSGAPAEIVDATAAAALRWLLERGSDGARAE